MQARQCVSSVLLIALALALAGSVGPGMAQGPEPTKGDLEPESEASVSAIVGSKFSYQGVLKEDGSPVSGNRDMTFRLYSDETCATQVGADIEKPGVEVVDGLFSVELSVFQSYFDGQGLWLETEVDSTAVGCQEILAVPYALGLRPGAFVTADWSAVFRGPVLGIDNEGTNPAVSARSEGVAVLATSDEGCAVEAQTESTSYHDAAVHGMATGGDGFVYGVLGEANAPMGAGVRGSNVSDTDRAYGVEGYSSSPSGIGVHGLANSSGASGVVGVSQYGVGIKAYTATGNPIEAWDYAPENRRFYVNNAGAVYADQSFHGGGADFAEMLPATEGLEPGDVLVVGAEGQLVRSVAAYDPGVVGVYSTQPGFVANADEEMANPGDVPLAIMGLVPVKASAENGPIAPGDLLVASSTSGHAMRAEADPTVGTIIGKAMGELDEGTGIIEMLVMLQ